MPTTRRSLLGFLPAGVALAAAVRRVDAAPASADGPRDGAPLDKESARLRDQVAAELQVRGLPGAGVALADTDGYASAFAVGLADLASGEPARPAQLYQIGSISKSLVALAIHVLVDRGRLDLDARIGELLPDAPVPPEPITIAQLLDHSSGLPDSAPWLYDSPQARLWVGYTPGSRFSYSNTGYALLGFVIERVTGLPFHEALNQLVLAPLGLTSSVTVIRIADRGRYATGHVPWLEDRPALPGARLTAGPWIEIEDAAGSVAMTMADMCRYIAFIARLAQGHGAPLFSDTTARLFATREGVAAPEYSPEARYANGFIHRLIDGRRSLEHTGGMVSFVACMTIDLATSAGCFVGVNASVGGYRPRALSRLGAQLRAAVLEGTTPPAAVPPANPFAIAEGAGLAGDYIGPGSQRVRVRADGAGLAIEANGRTARLFERAERGFATDHPDFATNLLEFGEPGAERHFWWAEDRFSTGGATGGGATGMRASGGGATGDGAISGSAVGDGSGTRWRAEAGVYVSNDPWLGSVAVFARGDDLVLEGWGRITPAGDGDWHFTDVALAAERVRFAAPLDGRFQHLILSGSSFRRCAHRWPGTSS